MHNGIARIVKWEVESTEDKKLKVSPPPQRLEGHELLQWGPGIYTWRPQASAKFLQYFLSSSGKNSCIRIEIQSTTNVSVLTDKCC